MISSYYEDLIRRGTEAADALDEKFKVTHPFGTAEAETIRDLVHVVRSLAS